MSQQNGSDKKTIVVLDSHDGRELSRTSFCDEKTSNEIVERFNERNEKGGRDIRAVVL